MIGYLPELYPDELVYSWFSRYLVHSGHRLHSVVLKELFCKRSDNPSKEFLGHLNEDAKNVIRNVLPLRELILQHTMVPQYARFLSLAEKKEALHRMAHDYCDPHFLFPILVRNEEDEFLRYCPACAQEDRLLYGETYWHRKHQLRGAKVCYKHGCFLEQSTVSAKSEQGYLLCSAEEYATTNIPRDCNNQDLLRYVQFVSAVFDAKINFENDVPICSVLYHAMAATDYMKQSGRSRHTQRFAEELRAYYESIGLSGIATINQIQRTLLMGQTEFSTVCQIAYFLGVNAEDMIAPALTVEQIEAESDAHYIRNRMPLDWAILDAETALRLEPLAQSVYDGTYRNDGRPERVSERLICRELGLLSHQLENLPRCREIMQTFYESYEQHWARRLVWAYHKLKTECGTAPFYWSDMRKISGVRKKHSEMIIPLICNYTDTVTAEDIITLMG